MPVERIDWPGLMQLGLVGLRLTPEVFWGLTPAELMLMAGADARPRPLSRTGLDALLARFPDRPGRARAEVE